MAFPLIVAPQSSAIAFQREGVWWDRALVLTTAAAAASSSSSSQDEEGAIVMLKRHLRQQRTVEEYGRNIKQLAARAQGLLSAGHPEGYVRAPPGLVRLLWGPGPLQVQQEEMGLVSMGTGGL